MLLTLNLRECWLGPKYSGKVETIEGRKIRPLIFEIDSLLLNDRELNALLANPHAWSRLYEQTPEGAIVPFMDCFKSMEFCKPIKGASVGIQYGEQFEHAMTFNDCKLTTIKLSLIDGGLTAFSCKVKTKPTLDDTLAELFEYFDERIRAELVFMPPRVQQDLPLNTAGLGEVPQDPKRAAAPKKRGARRSNNSQPTTVQ